MGVPKFYRWTSERYPCLSEVISEQQIPEFDNLYLDMNGIIHNCSHPNDDDVTFRITEEQIFADIFTYIEKLYRLISPKKVFFMAIDGVAPRAKMNQQRARRFMSARTAELQMATALKKGQVIPTEKRFDSNCITPGTYFMTNLHEKLADWVQSKVDADPLWQNRRIYLSGHNCPGEGEHKIMDFIRYERAGNSYDPNTRHCMYGLDADLIMLGLCSHEPHFSLLREEVKFSVKRTKNEKKAPKRADAAATTFHLLHLSLMREYLAWEFDSVKAKLSFPYDMERIIDDWVLMGFLVGNDFLPHLPHVHIHDDALPLLYETYKIVLPTLDGYLNEGGNLNLPRFQKFLKELAKNDKHCFMAHMEDEEFMNSKKTKPSDDDDLVAFEGSDAENEGEALEPTKEVKETENSDEEDTHDAAFVSSDEENGEESSTSSESTKFMKAQEEFSEEFGLSIDDPIEDEFAEHLALTDFAKMDDKEFENNVEACWTKTINNSFKRHKKSYYSEKMKYKNISKAELRKQAEGYVRGIQWNLHYYYHGCISWSWFYDHHYAPYISDVVDFADMTLEFEMSQPFVPFQQLLAVLPAASGECLPKPLRELMAEDSSPIGDFYPNDFQTDLNGKKNDWEAVVLIPFIDQKRLTDAMDAKLDQLTAEEKSRNTHGGHLLFTSDHKDNRNVAIRTVVHKDEFRIPKSTVVWGLLPNVKLDVFFPGFPTMKHLPHTGTLKQVNVNVFNMPSRKESMLLQVGTTEFLEKDLLELSSELLGEEVCIEWPFLKVALVDSITGDGRRYQKTSEDEVVVTELTPEELTQNKVVLSSLKERLMTRYAIDVPDVKVLVWIRRFVGITYQLNHDAQPPMMQPKKQFTPSDEAVPVLLPLVVKDILLNEGVRFRDLPIDKAFPMKNVVFVTNPKLPAFGYPALVEGYSDLNGQACKIKLCACVYKPEVDLSQLDADYEAKALKWYNTYDAARESKVNQGLFSRLTGTVLLWTEPREIVERGAQMASDNKFNIGLGLKYSRRNLETADYTRRYEYVNRDGYTSSSWQYSLLAIRLVQRYKQKFPELISFLERSCEGNDVYYAEDIWANETKRKEKCEQLKEFLAGLAAGESELLPCDTEYADRLIIGEIEKAVSSVKSHAVMSKFECSPSALFRTSLNNNKVRPDAEADYRILDRVVCVASGVAVNAMNQGTIVGLHGEKADVLFDKEFQGGSIVRGSSKASSLRLPLSSLLNITFGKHRKGKTELEKMMDKPAKKSRKTDNDKRNNRDKKTTETTTSPSGPYVPWEPKSKKLGKNEGSQKSEGSKNSKKKSPKLDEESAEDVEKALNKMLGLKIMTKKDKTVEQKWEKKGQAVAEKTENKKEEKSILFEVLGAQPEKKQEQPGNKISLVELLGGASNKTEEGGANSLAATDAEVPSDLQKILASAAPQKQKNNVEKEDSNKQTSREQKQYPNRNSPRTNRDNPQPFHPQSARPPMPPPLMSPMLPFPIGPQHNWPPGLPFNPQFVPNFPPPPPYTTHQRPLMQQSMSVGSRDTRFSDETANLKVTDLRPSTTVRRPKKNNTKGGQAKKTESAEEGQKQKKSGEDDEKSSSRQTNNSNKNRRQRQSRLAANFNK